MEHIVHLEMDGWRFEFRQEDFEGVKYWSVYSKGRSYRSPLRVSGNEVPERFFAGLAKAAVENHGL